MKFRPEHYFECSLDRIRQARDVFRRNDSFALCMYVSGVSVECMLRAFRLLKDLAFDERHDLLQLFKASGLMSIDEERMRFKGHSEEEIVRSSVELKAAMSTLVAVWRNTLRYASEKQARSF